MRDKPATMGTGSEIPDTNLKLRRLKVKPVEFSSPTLTRRKFSLKSPAPSESPSLPGASSKSWYEVSANLLEGDDPLLPVPPAPTVEESSEVWSQMTQFPADAMPVRSKPSEAVVSSQSSQSSQSSSGSYASCRETLSEQMDEEENVSVLMEEEEEDVEENDSHSKTLKNNDKNHKTDVNESEDMFDTSKDSVGAEMTKEKCREEDANLERSSSLASVSQEEEVEGNTVSSYRSNLVVTCQPSSSELPRRDCASLRSASPGM